MNVPNYLCILLVMLLSTGAWAGGGKAAYRHYVIGSFHFSEGNYDRALNHLKRAHALAPEEYSFNLALALALGKKGHDQEGLHILNQSDHLLKPYQTDYYQWRAMRLYVTGLIHCFGLRFYEAIPSFKKAIDLQKRLDNRLRLSNMYNALGYAEMMDQGRGKAKRHQGLDMHYHVHRRDMERGLDWFRQALEIDPYNPAALHNYERISDTLGISEAITYQYDSLQQPQQFVPSKYQYLPARMEALLEFGHYDEVVFLLDISGSMVQEKVACVEADRFRVMKEASLYLLDQLPETTKTGIGTIGGDCGTEPLVWAPVDSLDRKDTRFTLQFLAPDGTTPMLTILQKTPELFTKSDSTTKSIFFISDGENICDIPGVDICEWTTELRAQNIEINILTFLETGLGNTGAFAEYTCLADRSRGRILYLNGNTCSLQRYEFEMVDHFQLKVPELQRVNCWGPAVKSLWGYFPNAKSEE